MGIFEAALANLAVTDKPGCAAELGLAGEFSDERAAACFSDGEKSSSFDSDAPQTRVDDVADKGQRILDMFFVGGARVSGEAVETGGGDVGEEGRVDCNDSL